MERRQGGALAVCPDIEDKEDAGSHTAETGDGSWTLHQGVHIIFLGGNNGRHDSGGLLSSAGILVDQGEGYFWRENVGIYNLDILRHCQRLLWG